MAQIEFKKMNIRVEGYRGTWSVIDHMKDKNHNTWLMLEHNYYGDETCYLIVPLYDVKRRNEDYAMCKVYENAHIIETYDGIETALEDEGLID